MITLGLKEAARFLRLHPEVLRVRAKRGEIPGAKAGRAWVFIEEDLAGYLRSLYRPVRQALQVPHLHKEEAWHFADAVKSGGSTSLPKMGSEYADLLGLTTEPSRRNSTTS